MSPLYTKWSVLSTTFTSTGLALSSTGLMLLVSDNVYGPTKEISEDLVKEFNINYKDGYSNTGIVAWVEGNNTTTDKNTHHQIYSTVYDAHLFDFKFRIF